ncbi:MAG TPA: hypothetical protein VHG69_01275 [Thermoleophilaceae bacterium]|nr:hypothetical protein [Thermoleophilaceae bacterium]
MALPGEDPARERELLYERYLPQRRPSRALAAYYKLKPAVPRRAQLALRRALARRSARSEQPRWPIDDRLVRARAERLRRRLDEEGEASLPFVNFWPDRKRFAFVLTHDVEGLDGVRRLPEVLEVERKHGLVSSWNFVAEWYPLGDDVLDLVRSNGCEVGLHGIKHDGSLFRSRASFAEQLPQIRDYMTRWGAVGFRSPSTLRNADWMHELPCEYDSSFPQNDPFQPQPGGCCSPYPFFFGDVVELPVTLDQDHTLFELLRVKTIELWTRKATWLADNHAFVNVIVHPDYMNAERLRLYDELLAMLGTLSGGWHALPRDVARWWRGRVGATVSSSGGDPSLAGAPEGATIAWARPEGDRIAYEV